MSPARIIFSAGFDVLYAIGLLNVLEDIANTFADCDSNWWPFVFLRPPKHQKLTTLRAALVAALWGALVGSAANILAVVAREEPPFGSAASLPIIFSLIFFAALRLILGWAWNRRALRQRFANRADR